MIEKMGMSKVRVDLTNVVYSVERGQKVVVIIDRYREVAGIVPVELARAIAEVGVQQVLDILGAGKEASAAGGR